MNWEEELKRDIFPIGIWHDSPAGYERHLEYIKSFISKQIEKAKDEGFALAERALPLRDQMTRYDLLNELIGEIEELKVLHNHNSIPGYFDELDESCETCIANFGYQKVINLLRAKL